VRAPPDAEGRPAETERHPDHTTASKRSRQIATGPVIAIEVDPDTGELVELRKFTAEDRAHLFASDLELQRFATILADAHILVLSATVPWSVRRDLGVILDELDEFLHRGPPHLLAYPRARSRRLVAHQVLP
jgi:hypothetical protein